MAIPLNIIKFSDIQNNYGGINPISFSEYYANSTNISNLNTSNIPLSNNPININVFRGLKVDSNLQNINTVSENNITFGTSTNINLITDGSDNYCGKLTTINFPFYWFGTDYGTTNDIYWNSSQALTFGHYSFGTINWTADTAVSGILLGQGGYRSIVPASLPVEYPSIKLYNYNIKRISVTQTSFLNQTDNMQFDIRLIKSYYGIQFIEIRIINWSSTNGGQWLIFNGSKFYSIFSGSPPVSTGKSIVLKSDNLGYNWICLNNYSMPFNIIFPTIISNSISASFTLISGTTYYYIFNSITGTNTITFPYNRICKILIIGGGGGAGGGYAGSGGAGGNVYYNDSYFFNADTYTIIIGSGGTGGNYQYDGNDGSPTYITSLKNNNNKIINVNGGGKGFTGGTNIGPRSGGGTSANINGNTQLYSGGTGTDANGFWMSGGGAGAGQNGFNATYINSTYNYGNGGDGFQSSITGNNIYYAGGGFGGSYGGYPAITKKNGQGATNYGGGGSGALQLYPTQKGYDGQSGCVIISITF